jgi:hypothetical protein
MRRPSGRRGRGSTRAGSESSGGRPLPAGASISSPPTVNVARPEGAGRAYRRTRPEGREDGRAEFTSATSFPANDRSSIPAGPA